MSGDVYLRRVRDPEPLAVELARQAADEVERKHREYGLQPSTSSIVTAAHAVGVSYALVLDELERRIREREGSDGSS